MDEEDAEELLRLQHEMEIATKELRDSEHYCKLRNQLEGDSLLKNEFSRRIGSEKQVQMVIYALGSLVYGFSPHYQLALALLLREEVGILRIGEIQVFDPLMTPADVKLIKSFGCNALSVNEFARRRVEKPTLFFLPFACLDLVANLLEANWSSSMLDNLMILGTSMHEWVEERPDVISLPVITSEIERLTSNDRLRYIHTIKDWSIEFAIDEGHKFSPFRQLYWIFFNLDAGIDINSLLPSFSTLDKIQVDHLDVKPIPDDRISVVREASELSYSEDFKPNPKWKQRFSRGSNNYGYGGILYNDQGKTILSYMGPVLSHVERIEAAQVEGLKQGIRCFKQWLPNSSCSDDPKLIIEGSALNVITWANAFIPPPQRFREAFEEMTVMLGDINCLVYYVHEVANNKANELAKLGMALSEFSLIMCRESS
ncbi:hypothetical protein J5N97_008792 [Dioscorea zingiberensis]|uniref:SRR1-like domain-containing protein n=1 Tax=Dioscorea zingiberensis TaxID=325984 RepID=A0A9D5HLQ0_9LILI|nr:hypothetical protein J5N97_008792 [Dioscorea zingiberensis]